MQDESACNLGFYAQKPGDDAMKKVALIALAFLFALGVAQPPSAEARVAVVAGFGGGGCCYGGGYYGGYPYAPYPAYYYPYAVAPPPVVYAVPPPSPIIYAPPPQPYYAAPAAAAPVAVAPAAAGSPPASPTFIDGQGRTCRQFQASAGAQPSTACLQPDGSWRAVQ
jgi:hypothetical protein